MLIILQHHPVYTLGSGSTKDHLNFELKDAPFDVYRTERGGEVTYHGPGQLAMYPIINLHCHKMELHWYLRTLEEVDIRVLSSTFSIKASRLEGFTGVWVGGGLRKGRGLHRRRGFDCTEGVERRVGGALGRKPRPWRNGGGTGDVAEEVVIRVLFSTFLIKPSRLEGLTGVWDHRVGSIKGMLGESISSDGHGTTNIVMAMITF
ncbi:unnamed protein product [Ilex paraguariensis]|uniref:lipoyl(octanoyl) transferase n=1 Tax=Ilex paraguariensis TaxID=185542 RepID=A0ABC8SF80_9AQUA